MSERIRVIEFSLTDIIIDPAGCSSRLNTAMKLDGYWHLKGGCCDENTLYLSLATAENPAYPYRFAELCTPGKNDITEAILNRFYCGFSLITYFNVEQTLWAVFCFDDPQMQVDANNE